MASWKQQVIEAVRTRALSYRFIITDKALNEMQALKYNAAEIPAMPELDEEDVRDLLLSLDSKHLKQRFKSTVSNDTLYVFKPDFFGITVYLKVAIQDDCVVISLHEDR